MQQIIDSQFENILADRMLNLGRKLRGSDQRYHDEGPKRSADSVLSCIEEQLSCFIDSVAPTMRTISKYEHRLTGTNPMTGSAVNGVSLCGLRVLRSQIREIRAGRPAPLFSHHADELGEGPYNDKRVSIKSAAVALLQVLIETKNASKNVAAIWVTDSLNENGFKNPKGPKYASETIKYWHKNREKYKGEFSKYYKERLKHFRSIARHIDICRQCGENLTDEECRSKFFAQFSALVSLYAYRRV